MRQDDGEGEEKGGAADQEREELAGHREAGEGDQRGKDTERGDGS